MGLGGHVLWTAAARTLYEVSGRPVRVCLSPQLTDLLSGRLYRRDVSLSADPVFAHNPRLEYPPTADKSALARRVDYVADAVKRRLGLDAAYERLVFLLATRRWRSRGQFDVHIDLDLHSYAAEERPDRMVWKSGGHIVDILLATYGQTARTHQGELYFTSEEEQATDAFCQTHGLTADFVAIEPNSKASWFGDLRAWPVERWQEVVDRIVSAGRYPIVQLGEQGGQALAQTIDLRGKLPVRLAMCLMKRARLFLGQEGGLMHVARALDVPSVIVWGGLTLPEFAAYKDAHRVLCTYVDCAPCGLRGGCPYGKKCLTSIQVAAVVEAVHDVLPSALTPLPA